MDTEAIREKHRPARVQLLLVGESPPDSGKFFYRGGAMLTYTSRAFENAHGRRFSGREEFLAYFRECGCFLEDLSHAPVDQLGGRERRKVLEGEIENLAARIRAMHPDAVVSVLLRIDGYVREAVARAGCGARLEVPLPFPGSGHQNKYIERLADLVRCYIPREVGASEG